MSSFRTNERRAFSWADIVCGISRFAISRSVDRTHFLCYAEDMNCPVCNKSMRKIARRITNNGKEGDGYREYDKASHVCRGDDVWRDTEIPAGKQF